MKKIAIFYLIWRICDLVIAFIANNFDKYNEHFAYRFQLYHYNHYTPRFLIDFANYDGANYLHIAHNGYGLYQQAYFPLFPLLIRIFAPVFGHGYFLAGFFIANISFLFGLYFFKRYLEELQIKQKEIFWIVLFLLVFPTSFFFGAVYTEGLFFLFVSGALYFCQKKHYWRLAIFCILAGLTRLMGVFLIIPLAATLLFEQNHLRINQKGITQKINNIKRFVSGNIKLIFIALTPLLGLLLYMLFLGVTVHDPFLFYHSVSGFHTGRTTDHLILLPQVYFRYIKIFVTASHSFIYFVAVLEFIIFNLFLAVLFYDLWKLWKTRNAPSRISLIGLNLFSIINILLPTLTGTLTSLPRYAMLSLSFYIRLALIKNQWVRYSFLFVFSVFHILLVWLFIQGYFIS